MKNTLKISQKELHENLDYNPKTGEFHWKFQKKGRRKAGVLAGSVNNFGQRVICVNGIIYSCARLAWVYVNGSIKSGLYVSHKNGDKLDNSIDNLELITPQKRSLTQNRKKNKNRNVAYLPKSKLKYLASVTLKGKRIGQKYFKTAKEARAYAKELLESIIKKVA